MLCFLTSNLALFSPSYQQPGSSHLNVTENKRKQKSTQKSLFYLFLLLSRQNTVVHASWKSTDFVLWSVSLLTFHLSLKSWPCCPAISPVPAQTIFSVSVQWAMSACLLVQEWGCLAWLLGHKTHSSPTFVAGSFGCWWLVLGMQFLMAAQGTWCRRWWAKSLHSFGKHIWVTVTVWWVGGKGQGVSGRGLGISYCLNAAKILINGLGTPLWLFHWSFILNL